MGALPEVHEGKDLFGFLPFAQIGVGIAEGVGGGILRQEGQDAGLTATAHRDVMPLHQGMLAIVGEGVEIQIERLSGEQGFA